MENAARRTGNPERGDEEHFIPQQVGLPEERFDDITEDDHAWFELSRGSFQPTGRPATENLSVAELVENFKNAKGKWDESLFLL